MKIGFSGASSTGKSTISKIIANRLNLPYITEQARATAQQLGITNLNKMLDNPDLGRIYQFGVIINQIEAEEKAGDSFVTDRTVFDNMMYWNVYHSANNSIACSEAYFSLFDTYRYYDLIVYVPIEFMLQDDGFRYKDNDKREQEDAEIRQLLDDYAECKIIEVHGTVGERVKQVMKEINRWN